MRKRNRKIVSPVKGVCIPIDEVADEAFASKVMGDGFAVIPGGDTVVAPVAGQLVALPKTRHAVCFRTKDGLEVLVHVGIDTVRLGGEGFTGLRQVGEWVKAGTPVLRFDDALMKARGLDMTTIVVLTEGYPDAVQLGAYGREVEAGEVLIS